MMRLEAFLLLCLAAALPAPQAAGDWIVTRDGTRVETRGPWEVEGRQVVFTRPDGTLASLRAADVDLAASAAASSEPATEPAPGPAAESPARRPRPVLVLTNDDLPRPEETAVEGEDEEEALAGSAEDAEREPVEVVSWKERGSDEADGLEIEGTVRNSGLEIAAEIQVVVTVPGNEGEPPATALAFLESSALGAGQATTFRALLPGIYSLLAEPSFEVRSEAFSLRRPPHPAPKKADEIEGERSPRR